MARWMREGVNPPSHRPATGNDAKSDLKLGFEPCQKISDFFGLETIYNSVF